MSERIAIAVSGDLLLLLRDGGTAGVIRADEADQWLEALAAHLNVEILEPDDDEVAMAEVLDAFAEDVPPVGWRAIAYGNGRGAVIQRLADWQWGGLWREDGTCEVIAATAAEAAAAVERLAREAGEEA